MASPISTGGSGIHFESQVGAYFLAAVLGSGVVRGLPAGATAVSVKFQRAFEGQLLDDVIVSAVTQDGTATLSLQAKRTFSFGDNELFHEVMAQCWATFTNADFRPGRHRFGIAIAISENKFEQAGRNVLAWARQSSDAKDFLQRVATENFASDGMRSFLKTIRDGLDRASSSSVEDESVWLFLKHFVVLHFDFSYDEASTSLIEVTERLRYALQPQVESRASDLWRALVSIVDAAKPTAGSIDRAQLIEALSAEFSLTQRRQWSTTMARLRDVAAKSLDDIKSKIGGIHLSRLELVEKIKAIQSDANTNLIEIVGDAGSGKSAVLKEIASEALEEGPVLVLKTGRLPHGIVGWAGLATAWQLDAPLEELISELSCVEIPCFFIDGIERITAPGVWLAINDVLRAIHASASGHRWKVVISTRANSLAYRTHLDFHDATQSRRLIVNDLTIDEIRQICEAYPRLASAIDESGRARDIAARPYFLDRLIRRQQLNTTLSSPISEIDLMIQIWTSTAGADGETPQLVMARQDALIAIGRQKLAQPSRPLSSVGLNGDALVSLISDDLLRHDDVAREVVFAHDIVEDWVLCQALRLDTRGVAKAIEGLDQPLWLLDPVLLLAQWQIESVGGVQKWKSTLHELSAAPLSPRWRRAALCAVLQSPRSFDLLQSLEVEFSKDEGGLLKELMLAMRTLEVDPDPRAFDETMFSNLNHMERIELSNAWAIPRLRTWRNFIPWIVPQLDTLAPRLVAEATWLLKTVSDAYHTFPRWAAKPIAKFSRKWLVYIEEARGFDAHGELRKRLNALGVDSDDAKGLRQGLRMLLITCADEAKQDVTDYLSAVAEGEYRGSDFLIKNSNFLVRHLPREVVDFFLKVMIEPIEGNLYQHRSVDAFNTLGIKDSHLFFPASHLRPPFLALLRHAPEEGLRLINGLCNHAMGVWRHILESERSGTPLPLKLTFDWGEKQFWGHAREYTWYRAIGPGPYPIESALMALEVWLEEQIADGKDPITLFRQVLESNDCVGAIGACVAVATAYPKKCLEAALPFVTSPALCSWDIRRRVKDTGSGMANLIGSPSDRPFLVDVAKRNQLPHRGIMLRDLLGHYVLLPDGELRTEFLLRMERVGEEDLPFDFLEQKGNSKVAEDLRDFLTRLKAMAEPKNWKCSEGDKGELLFECVLPTELSPSLEYMEAQAEQGKSMRLALWAEKSLDARELSNDISLVNAIGWAKELDTTTLFDEEDSDEDFHLHNRKGAVAGTAAAVVRFHERLDSETIAWARDVLYRALASPLGSRSFLYEMSEVSFHPHVLGIEGLSALVKRELSNDEDHEALLVFLCHPLIKVKKTVIRGLSECWEVAPLLCWQAFALGMRLSVVPCEILASRKDNDLSLFRSEQEHEWMDAQIKEIWSDFGTGDQSTLPVIPSRWERIDTPENEKIGRHSITFMWHIAPAVLEPQPLQHLLGDAGRRSAVLKLTSELLQWTVDDATPPDDWHGYSRAYEWSAKFISWCAKLTKHIPLIEVQDLIVAPIVTVSDSHNGESLLSDLIQDYARVRFSQNEIPNDETLAIWSQLSDAVYQHRNFSWARKNDFISNGYGTCVLSLIFTSYGYQMFQAPWAGINALTPSIDRWVKMFGASPAYFSHWIQFVLHTGPELLPDPALGWLHAIVIEKRDETKFWQVHGNGDKAAILLSSILNGHSSVIAGNDLWLKQMAEVADYLVKHGVRHAAYVQQQLAALQK